VQTFADRIRARNQLNLLLGVRKRRTRKIPRQVGPKLIELEYGKRLISLLNQVKEAYQPLFAAMPALLRSNSDTRSRVDSDEADQARALLATAREKVSIRNVDDLAKSFANRTSEHNKTQLDRQLRAGIGADIIRAEPNLQPIMSIFVVSNVELVTKLTADLQADLRSNVMLALQNNENITQFAERIQKTIQVKESRARLIARDQIGKLYGQINAKRQTALGIKRFIWRTSHDERVRDEHEALDGEVFAYDDPPSEGLPGEPIQCRCYAEPVLDDLLGEL
jgi:SPP1 gp7 family putative phage head morphogenesis protein